MPNRKRHGLWTREGKKRSHEVPLKEISVNIKIIGFVAEVTSNLLYSNTEENPIEAEFTFPVDDGSAVFRFEAEIEGRHIVAEIQEREQAKLTYKDATERGYTALLLKEDEKAGDIFQCSLGNLPPKTDAKILFSYVIELPQEPDGKIRFTLPTVLNPRYSPDVGRTVAAEGATYESPKNIPYKFNMSAVIRGNHKTISVTSTGDRLKLEPGNDNATMVTLAEEFNFDHDLSFLVEYENCFKPQIVLEKGNPEAAGFLKEDVLMLNFYPDLNETSMTTTGEYIFVIDRSGSMEGSRIKNAKKALFLFLKSLPVDCYFNVVSFGSSHTFLFQGGSSKYTKASLKTALALQATMEADMGGTEIYEPFREIFSKDTIKGHARQIFLLTDGEVGNTTQLIGLVKSHAHKARVFTVGIGSGVSTSLIKGVARAGNGKAEFISDVDRIQPKVVSLLKCATLPAMSDIELDWGLPRDVTAIPIPDQPPTILTVGGRLCLYTLLKGIQDKHANLTGRVTLKGHCNGTPIQHKVDFPLASSVETDQTAPLHRLAAKTQIKELETEEASLFEASSPFDYESCSVDEDALKEKRQNLVLLSTSANIISKVTAFVAIDIEAGKQVKMMKKRHCPVPYATPEFRDALKSRPSYFGGQERFRCLSAAPQACSFQAYPLSRKGKTARTPMSSVVQRGEIDQLCETPASSGLFRGFASWGLFGVFGIFSKVKSLFWSSPAQDSNTESSDQGHTSLPADDNLMKFIDFQEIQGHWRMSKEIAKMLGIHESEVSELEGIRDSDVVTTLAVIAWLRSKFRDRHEEWEMIEKKALSWLNSKIEKGQRLEDLLKKVTWKLWPKGPKNVLS